MREFNDLDERAQGKIEERLGELAEEPRGHQSIKLAGVESTHRSRVGNFRIVYEIDDSRRVITVVRVAHRKDVYR